MTPTGYKERRFQAVVPFSYLFCRMYDIKSIVRRKNARRVLERVRIREFIKKRRAHDASVGSWILKHPCYGMDSYHRYIQKLVYGITVK